MITKESLVYRQVFTLKDGANVLLRPVTPDDYQGLTQLFMSLTPDESRFMRHDVTDPKVLKNFVENVDYDHILPIIALVGDRIVGLSSLHFNDRRASHRAEVRIFLAKDFRRRGLGTKISQAMIDIAKRRNLYLLEVQIVRDLSNDIKAMEKVGFETQCILEDYYMLPDGELRDVVIMLMKLRTPEGEF
jgi:RimJ/RimL family protein N-acetyltransferase